MLLHRAAKGGIFLPRPSAAERGEAVNQSDNPGREYEGLGDRLSQLSRASLRITETLDLDTVLQGVVDGACSLTGARHGGITALDVEGRLQAFITSGLTPEEHRLFVELPGGPEFFAYLSMIPGPLRLADFSGHARAAGLPEIDPPLGPVGSFLGMPIRHLGRQVGNLYLSGKEGGREFTQEDEDVLVLFASQAAMAIANARKHREEQLARADLETLINTVPVGVVVFDARTGAPLSINHEARRIVDGLRVPDQSLEQLLEVLAFRRADGREISLKEFPAARALSTGETVRAEEIVIQAPNGRSVTTIVNATPVHSEEGELQSFVVTLQDMAPLEQLARQRAEFLGMVSQELLTPLTSIKGAAAAVLEESARLDPAEARQYFRIIGQQADRMRGLVRDLLDVAHIEAGLVLLDREPTDLAGLVGEAQSVFLDGGAGNPVDVDLPSDLPPVAADRQRIGQVLDNLLSNASRYSPEGLAIAVSAWREDPHVAVCVADQGRGIPAQQLPRLFRKFPVLEGGDAERRFEAAGLGLAVCRGIVEAHGGRIRAESDGPGLGSRFIFTLPAADDAVQGRSATPGRSSAGQSGHGGGRERILVADDDPQVLWYVRNTLSRAGYTLTVTGDSEEVERLIVSERPHLVLLDPAQIGADGFGLMRRITELTDVPVVFLSGQGRRQDVALALDMGADDYIVKPFSPTELVARVAVSLRRRAARGRAVSREPFLLGDLAIDYGQQRVTVAGREVVLTETEYRLLYELSVNGGQVLSWQHLMNRVWAARETGDSQVVRAYVRRLRHKLGDTAANPRYIFNERRMGYRMGHAEERGA